MLKYFGVFSAMVKKTFAYRTDFIFGVLGSFISLFFIWFIWSAVFNSSTGIIAGFTFEQMISYMCLSVIFHSIISSGSREFDIEHDVRTGRIAMRLINPVSYPLTIFSRDLGAKAVKMVFKIIPVIIVTYLILNVSSPISWLFVPSLCISYLISYTMVFFTGIMAFWTKGSIWGIRMSRDVIVNLLSGSMIPIIMFPDWLGNVAMKLPFISLFHIPVSIYLGNISGTVIYYQLLLQILWLVVFIVPVYLIWKKAEKKTFVQGG